MQSILESLRLFSNEQLLAEVPVLVARERTATAMVVASLAEVDVRELYLARGFSSLYTYCEGELRMSEGAAYRRIAAARAVARFPVALDYLVDGSLSLTTLTVLAPALTVDNYVTLLEAARGKTRREVERQVAALRPNVPDLVEIRILVPRATHEKLLHAQDLLRHEVPDGNVVEILDRSLTLLIQSIEKKKLGRTDRPRRARPLKMGSRHIPAAIKRAVTKRDGARCAFVGTQGRCEETGFLEFHHVVPFAGGGATTVDNIQLRCRAHNQYEADQEFGPPSVARETPPAYGDGSRAAWCIAPSPVRAERTTWGSGSWLRNWYADQYSPSIESS